jgi:hypothetical protein
VKKRLPLLIVLGGAVVLWKTGAFGLLVTERTIVFRFPVPYADVRKVELQVWAEGALVKRQESTHPTGLAFEPSLTVPLARGNHRAIATVWLGPTARGFVRDFELSTEDTVVVDFALSSD